MSVLRIIIAIVSVLFAAPALARGTLAGTLITNEATVDVFAADGTQTQFTSNIASFTVDEILDVAVVRDDNSDVIVQASDTNKPITFTISNKGNGPEAFSLMANFNLATDDFDPLDPVIVFDSNGNGIYDPQVDVIYVRGQNDPLLEADASIKLFVLGSIPASVANANTGRTQLTARATTGTGRAGTTYTGAGTNGVDAITGATTASASAEGVYLASAVAAQLMKSQTVRDPSGGTAPVRDAIVTYALAVQLSGSGDVRGVSVVDPIPTGTSYVPGSLKLNDLSISDSADSDAGAFLSNEIRVVLGTVRAPSVQTITFQVKLD